MSLSITCCGLAAVLCLLKSFVYVPHFRFASHLLAEQLIRVVSWPDSLCPYFGRFTVKGQIRRVTAEGSGHTKLTLGDKERVVARQPKTAEYGLVCQGLYDDKMFDIIDIKKVICFPCHSCVFLSESEVIYL